MEYGSSEQQEQVNANAAALQELHRRQVAIDLGDNRSYVEILATVEAATAVRGAAQTVQTIHSPQNKV